MIVEKNQNTRTSGNNMFCSPRTENTNNKYTKTCYSKKSLELIAKTLNKTINKEERIPISKNKYKLWNDINNKMTSVCKKEWCWIKQNVIKMLKNEEINTTFRPFMPKSWYKDKTQWLNTLDIENVMNQYEDRFEDFLFLGPVPIDFDSIDSHGECIIPEICKLNIEELIKDKIYKIGIIFNLDKHDQPGSHWVALYIDIKKRGCYFFDSYGVYPPKEVEILMNRLKKQYADLYNKKYNLYYNDIRHQYKNSECGVYSMYFIIQFLSGISFKKIIENIVFDDEMLDKRHSLLYTPSNID